MSNRKARRAEAKAFAKARKLDQNSAVAQRAVERIQEAQQTLQRRMSMHDLATRACQTASALKAGDEWLAAESDKTDAVDVAEHALDLATHGLLEAYLDAFDALADLDQPVSPIEVVPAIVQP